MNEAMENTASACDRLLDYVYGELNGDELEQFKLHLLTCEKCKRELQGLERVRSAVKQAMPDVEPPVDKMAQLMHAAAQQKPKRGKVLMFVRRVVSHPAYAAAAVFVLVATTVTVNMSRNAFKMPAPEAMHEPVPAIPAPAADPGGPATAPAGAPVVGGAKELQAAPPADVALGGDERKREKAPNKEMTVELKTEPETYTVRRTAPAKKSGYVSQPVNDKSSDADGLVALDDLKKPQHHSSRAGAGAGKDEEMATGRVVVAAKPAPPAAPAATAAPPPPPPKAKLAQEGYYGKNTRAEGGRMNAGESAEVPSLEAPARQAPPMAQNQAAPAQAASTPAPALAESKAQQRDDNANAHQQKTADPMALKKQFLSLVATGRCPDAVTLYQQIDRQYSNLFNEKENMEYVRCLRQTGQNELANEIDKRVQEQTKVNAMRASKKSKKAPASKPAESDSSGVLAPTMK
jgi:hypothetical protein